MSTIQTPRISSKILRCASCFQLSSWCLDIPMEHRCTIYYFSSPWLISHSVVFLQTSLASWLRHCTLSTFRVVFIVTIYTTPPLRLEQVTILDDLCRLQIYVFILLVSFLPCSCCQSQFDVKISLCWTVLRGVKRVCKSADRYLFSTNPSSTKIFVQIRNHSHIRKQKCKS